ncbi:nucleotidyltransferase domain-containing protein [Marinilabilia rubra]|uniref:Nucleotidyltransferase family protein n=1 Tax=Marinilabilia rubra TaxID=2162893 RepID=A0A2U2B6P6_9BACT|nr:nucleotidyltransferase family protein [Marinilabilia rubra]PWD98748.1 hypothetical protein DDZ16_13490 [Marinilabilia rubra]
MEPFKSPMANMVFELCKPNQDISSKLKLEKDDEESLLYFAARNGVAPWLFYRINNASIKGVQFSDRVKAGLRMQYLQTLVMNQQKWKVFKELHALAAENNIQIIPLKGTALAFSLYPEEALRPMGDIDLLVPDKDIFKLRDLMLNNGAKPVHVPISKLHDQMHAHISALSWQNIMIEPHQRLFAMGSALNPSSANLFGNLKRIKNHPEISVFDDTMQAYHLITHAFKGYKMGGMRLGWLLDIALILNRHKKDSGFLKQVKNLNPKAEKQIDTIIQWSCLLLDEKNEQNLTTPFPPKEMFLAEQDPKTKHKKMVLQEIAGLPGIKNKANLLFREFFPEIQYMDHQFGKHRGIDLLKLYLKRITGRINRPDN